MKVRIGKCYDTRINKILYQLQFKFPDEARYKGYSNDLFKTYEDAEKALNLHINGKREYKYKTSIKKEKRMRKGNKVTISKVLFCRILVADDDFPGSITWFKFKKNE